MSRRIFVIANPMAGKHRSGKILSKLSDYLDHEQLSYEIFMTKKKGAKKVVKNQLREDFTDLIIVGGDGTINEAVNGLKYDIPVSIIPCGTGNDFCKNLSLGKTLQERIETACHGPVKRIDIGICNGRKFVNGFGLGFDGQIVEDMAAKRVPLLSGHAAYYYHVLRILGGYREKKFKYSLDGKEVEKDLILLTVGNGHTYGGGFKLMPEASIVDGVFEICQIGKISGFKRFLNISKLSNGTHTSMKAVSMGKACKVVVEENPALYAHVDGERVGQPPFEIELLPGALQIRCH